MSTTSIDRFAVPRAAGDSVVRILFLPVQALVAAPVFLFLLTLTVFLFRPPDVTFYGVDRIALGLLVAVVLVRAVALRHSICLAAGFAGPMIGLSALAITSALAHPFDAGTWSVLAAKTIVPFTLFWLSSIVFRDEAALISLEKFLLILLAYLSFTAIAFLVGAHQLVFPRFILDESLGIHADRARGPFLQAVANGVTLNMLALLALDRYRRRMMPGIGHALLLASLPLAILATRTRGVWLSFAASVALLALCAERGLRRVCLGLIGIGGVAFFAVLLVGDGLKDRLVERSPVEFRMAAYQAGWEMFLERPFAGWGTNQVQSQLPGRISTFAGQSFAVHNTYLDVLLEHGLLGLGLYLWLVARLFQLRKGGTQEEPDTIASVRSLWPLLLGVYFVNASFVVMNYQFVNGLLFTLAGILAAHSPSTGVAKEFSEEKRRPPSVFPTTDGRR